MKDLVINLKTVDLLLLLVKNLFTMANCLFKTAMIKLELFLLLDKFHKNKVTTFLEQVL